MVEVPVIHRHKGSVIIHNQPKPVRGAVASGVFRPRRVTAIGGFAALALAGGSIAFAGYGDNSSDAASPAASVAQSEGRARLSTTISGVGAGLGVSNSASVVSPQIRFVAPGDGVDTRLNMPDVNGLSGRTDPAELESRVPELRPSSMETAGWVYQGGALFQRSDGDFSAESRYVDESGRAIVIIPWTPLSTVEVVALRDSPVRRFEETSIRGLVALALLPTPLVSGLAPRDILFATSDRVVWVHGEGFGSDSDFLSIAESIAAKVN